MCAYVYIHVHIFKKRNVMDRIIFHIFDSQKDRLNNLCKITGIKRAELLRQMIDDCLPEYEKKYKNLEKE